MLSEPTNDPEAQFLPPMVYKAVIVVVVSVSIVAFMYAWASWSKLGERAWMLFSEPDLQAAWKETSKGILRSLFALSGLTLAVGIWGLVKAPFERRRTGILTLFGSLALMLMEIALIVTYWQHWSF